MFTLFLQAFLRGDTEVLKDWCHEAVSSLFMYHVLLLAVLKLGGVVLISLHLSQVSLSPMSLLPNACLPPSPTSIVCHLPSPPPYLRFCLILGLQCAVHHHQAEGRARSEGGL